MQFDYMEILYKYGIYAALIIGASFLAFLYRSRFARAQYQRMEDTEKLEAPSFEKQESGIVISDPDDSDEP